MLGAGREGADTPAPTNTPQGPTPTPAHCNGDPVAAALGFDVFACDDANVSNSDVAGQMAVAGNATLQNYSIGSALPASNGARDDLVVGGNLTYNTGQMYAGNAVYGATANVNNVGFLSGSLILDNPVNFAAACTDLWADSLALCAMAGTNVAAGGTLVISGANPGLNVFSVSAAALAGASSVQISAPAGATVVINVTGGAVTIANKGITVSGTDREHVLWNLCGATTLTISGVALEGSVLAPYTDVSFNNGHINGQLIGGDVTGNGQSHHHPFGGC